MYRKTLAAILITLVTAWILGGVLSSHKAKKAALAGLVLLAAVAALVWVLAGVPPVPPWVVRRVRRLPG